jgi:hypothetical protein
MFLQFLQHPIKFLHALYIAHLIDCQFIGFMDTGHTCYNDYQTQSTFIVFELSFIEALGRRNSMRIRFNEAGIMEKGK